MGTGTPIATASVKSIRGWVACDGTTDDSLGTERAFAAAAHGAFTLIVDCPVRLKIGLDIGRSIFIESDTTVEFTGDGKFFIDNLFHPAFVAANARNITLTGWNVEFDAGLPVDPALGGYTDNGVFLTGTSFGNPTGAFNDIRLTKYLNANRNIIFDTVAGYVRSYWVGTTNPCAVFYLTGDTSNVTVSGMHIYAPAGAGVDRYIPVVFALAPNWRSNQTVTAKTPATGKYVAIPHDLTFSDIVLDGTYMGWVGGVRDSVFENIRSHRYGDLQDSHGEHVGGVKKWFAPPHLFYFIYSQAGDAALFNTNIQIKNVVDDGPRNGMARDKGGEDSISGYALSLKLGCVDCSVDNYKSTRPDGFLDVLPSDGLVISNVVATYNSVFTHNMYPGWRFPSTGYKNVTFENISLTDLAPSSITMPIGNATEETNEGLVFAGVKVGVTSWSASSTPVPRIYGPTNTVSLDYTIGAGASRIDTTIKNDLQVTLQAIPAAVKTGGSTELVWNTRQATSCTASGGWTGAVGNSGSQKAVLTVAGSYHFDLTCRSGNSSSTTSSQVVVAD